MDSDCPYGHLGAGPDDYRNCYWDSHIAFAFGYLAAYNKLAVRENNSAFHLDVWSRLALDYISVCPAEG